MPVTYVCFTNTNPAFGPAMRIIASITNSNPAIITTTIDHGYVSGTIVRLEIPPACGMQQANQLTGYIVVLTSTSFTMNIDTTGYDVFVVPTGLPPWVNVCPQVVPIGEVNETLKAALLNILP